MCDRRAGCHPRGYPADLPRRTDSANAFPVDDYRFAALFGKCLYLEGRGRPTTDLFEEKSQILLDPLEENTKLRFGAHVRRVARGQRGTVIGKAKHSMTFAQQRAREPTLLLEGIPSGVKVMRSTRPSRARMPGTCSAFRHSFIVNV